ncbi:MAG: hypothetical protein R2822_20490 [Spirosomataceae bacterium]
MAHEASGDYLCQTLKTRVEVGQIRFKIPDWIRTQKRSHIKRPTKDTLLAG